MSCTTILYPRCLCPIQWLNPSFRDTRLLQSALCVFGCKRWKPCWFLILACNLGNNSPSMPRTIKNVGRQLVISFPLWCNCHTRQPSFSSERLGTIVVTEWLGKCLFRIVTFDYSGCRVSTVFFVARSTHRLPGILMPRTALTSKEPGCSFVPQAFHVPTINFPLTNTGVVLDGIGVTPVASVAASISSASSVPVHLGCPAHRDPVRPVRKNPVHPRIQATSLPNG